MTGHLKSCFQKANTGDGGKKKAAARPVFHLVVQGRYAPQYWMHLAVPKAAQLELLDQFLRDIWLECCGHTSAFEIEGTMYSAEPMGMQDEPTTARLQDVVRPDVTFHYEYDFGSATHLKLKVLSEYKSDLDAREVRLLARNEPPVIPCSRCGAPAVEVCTECVYSDEGWLCRKCAAGHECGEDMFLPVVNSPRVGVCGYTG
jgi:hypothetical protein